MGASPRRSFLAAVLALAGRSVAGFRGSATGEEGTLSFRDLCDVPLRRARHADRVAATLDRTDAILLRAARRWDTGGRLAARLAHPRAGGEAVFRLWERGLLDVDLASPAGARLLRRLRALKPRSRGGPA